MIYCLRKQRAAFIVFLLCIATLGRAQTEGLGSWTVLNVRYSFNPKWLVWAEGQTRSYRFYNQFFYYEAKGGFQYNLSTVANVLMGVGNYATYTPGGNFKRPVQVQEIRLWEQLVLNNTISHLLLEHRYRIEQRWLAAGYRNRFRYRLNLILPIGKPKLEPHTPFATAFNEVFLTNQAPYFERNRLFGGAGYQFSKTLTLQVGYINQFDYRANGTSITNHFLQTTFFFNFRQPEKAAYRPSTMD